MSPTKFYERARASLHSRLGLPLPLIEAILIGQRVRVRYGSVRAQPDYDDAWLLALACHAKHILDAGANVGQAALLALQSPSVHNIVLVDPNPDALIVAAENLIRNRLGGTARFVTAFLSDTDDGSVTFSTVGTGAAGSRYAGHAATAARKHRSTRVPTVTVDTLCHRLGFAPDLVKIDVEGAEHEVLSGAYALARRRQTRFLVEMHSPPELPMVENARRVLDWCGSHGYSTWYLAEHRLIAAPADIGHRGRCHLLLQPAGWPYPLWLAQIGQGAPPRLVDPSTP